MTTASRHSAPVNLVFGEIELRISFHMPQASSLAGGPIEIEFCAELIRPDSVHLRLEADRVRGRESEFEFTATFAGVTIEDPAALLPDMGGITSVAEIIAGDRWRERIILNEFVRLEETVKLLEPDTSGELVVTCRRRISVAIEQNAALALPDIGPTVEATLVVDLRRDDAALVALVEKMLRELLESPAEERERPLRLLLGLRAPAAVERWSTLVNHGDRYIADRAGESLARVQMLQK